MASYDFVKIQIWKKPSSKVNWKKLYKQKAQARINQNLACDTGKLSAADSILFYIVISVHI